MDEKMENKIATARLMLGEAYNDPKKLGLNAQPSLSHLDHVATLLQVFAPEWVEKNPDLLLLGLLHDSLKLFGTILLDSKFGRAISEQVKELTTHFTKIGHPSFTPEQHQVLEAQRIWGLPLELQIVKVADLIGHLAHTPRSMTQEWDEQVKNAGIICYGLANEVITSKIGKLLRDILDTGEVPANVRMLNSLDLGDALVNEIVSNQITPLLRDASGVISRDTIKVSRDIVEKTLVYLQNNGVVLSIHTPLDTAKERMSNGLTLLPYAGHVSIQVPQRGDQ